jgi:aminoglycoside 6'-N-acetyltransferase I
LKGIEIRPVERPDERAWHDMRQALWPGSRDRHADDIERYFTGKSAEPVAVLLAFEPGGRAVGFIELSIRAYAEGCSTDHVAFVEGWYVAPDVRRRGVGAALMQAAETWGSEQGCMELGSDTEIENELSAAAHRALGFADMGTIRCFLKPLRGPVR